MELRTYLSIAARYRWQLILIPLIAALVALAATYVISPRFVGVAVVQLIPEEVEPRTVSLRDSAGASTVALGLRDPTELLAQGVIESIGSADVARHISQELQIAAQPTGDGWAALKSQVRQLFDDIWALVRFGYIARPPQDEAIAQRVSKSLEAELVRGSYFMEISATWRDPQTAASMANAAVEGVIQQSRDVAHASATEQRQFLEEQRAVALNDVEAARAAMLQYSSSSGVVEGSSLRAAVSVLEEARAAQRQNGLDLAEARRQLEIARQQLDSLSPEVVARTSLEGVSQPAPSSTARSVTPNLTYQTLEARVAMLAQDVAALETRGGQLGNEVTAQLELQLSDARQRQATIQSQLNGVGLSQAIQDQLNAQAFAQQQEVAAIEARRDETLNNERSQTDGELVEARRRLEVARQQLEATSPSVESVVTTVSAPVQMSSEQTSVSPNPVYQSIQRDVLSFEQRVKALEEQQPELTSAVQAREQELRDLTASDGQLQALSQELALASQSYARRTEEWYNALMDESRPIAPIRLIDAAVAPLYPAYPIKVYWTLIGAAAGLAVALVLVFVRYNTDMALRVPEQAADALRMPLLTVVPGGRSRTRRGGVR